jgi:membrane protein
VPFALGSTADVLNRPIGQRIASLGMILAIAFLLLVSLVVSASSLAFGDYISPSLPHVFSSLMTAIAFFVSLAIITLIFGARRGLNAFCAPV